jgi:hypothetical protein
VTPPTRRLNITNGDSAAGTLSEAGIEGKIVPWRDVLHEGPVDTSLALEQLSKQRARFIAGEDWQDLTRVSADFAERDRLLRDLENIDEVVLWFEDDLYDQLQLLQLLDYFGGAAIETKVSLIVVDGYIPPLSVSEIKALDRKRARVTREQLDLGRKAWRAFGSPDPTSIAALLDGKTSSLPYLARALMRHLEEFPSTTNGLSRSESEALTVIAAGHNTPVRAFLEVAKLQESIFLGDTVFYSYLQRLSGKTDALITWKDGSAVVAPDQRSTRQFVEGELALTALGRDVLAGKKDWQRINKQLRWLGGVEISPGDSGWRWDPDKREIRRAGTRTPPTAARKTVRKSVKKSARKSVKPVKSVKKSARKSARKSVSKSGKTARKKK